MRAIFTFGFFLSTFVYFCSSDMYLHFPHGSNNRLNGNQANVRNANRLFNSQVGVFESIIYILNNSLYMWIKNWKKELGFSSTIPVISNAAHAWKVTQLCFNPCTPWPELIKIDLMTNSCECFPTDKFLNLNVSSLLTINSLDQLIRKWKNTHAVVCQKCCIVLLPIILFHFFITLF